MRSEKKEGKRHEKYCPRPSKFQCPECGGVLYRKLRSSPAYDRGGRPTYAWYCPVAAKEIADKREHDTPMQHERFRAYFESDLKLCPTSTLFEKVTASC